MYVGKKTLYASREVSSSIQFLRIQPVLSTQPIAHQKEQGREGERKEEKSGWSPNRLGQLVARQ